MTKRLVKMAGLAAGVVGVVAASTPDGAIRRFADRLARDVRYAAASAPASCTASRAGARIPM
jgi:hypothetical protein